MKEFQDKSMLNIVMTQNIDGLEIEAGVKIENCIQAHGHYRTAHCIKCGAEASVEKFNECVMNETILYCEK